MLDMLKDIARAIRSVVFIARRAIKPKKDMFYLINLTPREPIEDPRGEWDYIFQKPLSGEGPEKVAKEITRALRDHSISSRRIVYINFAGPSAYLPALFDELGDDRHRIHLRWFDLRDQNKLYELKRPERNYVPAFISVVSIIIGFIIPL